MLREVPEGWIYTKLEEVAEIQLGGTPSRSVPSYWAQNAEDGLPWLSIADMRAPEIFNTKERITALGAKNSNVKLIRTGTVLMSFKLSIGKVAIAKVPLYTNEAIAAFIPDTSRLENLFLRYALPHFVGHVETDQAVKGVTLNKEKLRSLVLPLPPLHEQRCIAEILSSVDEAIVATRAVIAQTRKVRSEILTASFPEDLAIGRSTADDAFKGWSIEPALSICESIIDCKNRTPPVTKNGYAVVRTPNVRNGRFRYDGLQFTDKQSFQEWTAKGVPKAGDILFTREAPYGEVCMAPAMAFCLGQRMMFMRPDTSRVSSDFLLYALQSAPVKKEMFRRAGGSTVGHLRVGDVRELPIPVAPTEVQLRLTSTLRSLDEALDSNEETLSRLEDCKSALICDLLTGRKRVTKALPMAAE